MKIHKLIINNFGSYVGQHTLTLSNRGLVLIEGNNLDEFKMDSNGSGKSQIPDSLDWCITGVIPRGDHVDSIINDKKDRCSVQVEIEAENKDTIVIKRERIRKKKTSIDLIYNGQFISALDTKETQKLIYKYLGIDRDILHSTVLFAQTDLVHYADSTDSKRMEILTSLLQLDSIDDLLSKSKDELKDLNKKQDQLLGSVESLQSQLQLLKKEDHDYQINQWEIQRRDQLNNLIEDLNEKKSKLQVMPGYSPDTINRIIEELKYQIIPEIKDESKLQDVNDRIGLWKEKIGGIKCAIQAKNDELSKIENNLRHKNTLCPTCGQSYPIDRLLIDKENVQEELIRLKALYDGFVMDFHVLETEFNEEQIRINEEYQKAVGHNVVIRNEIEKQNIALGKLNSQLELFQSIESSIAGIEKQIVSKEQEVNPWLEVKQRALSNIKIFEDSLCECNSKLNSIGVLKSLYEFWVEGFGPKGLKSYILDSKLKELNDSINYWVKILTGGTIWVELGSYKVNRSGKLTNSPDVKVCRWNTDGTITTRDYKSWSGGEKQRISLAIDFGLSRIIANRSNNTYDIIFLDEIFKHLDRGGKESVMEMLQILAKEKSSVFVVEHDSEFKSMFESKICVTKKDGVSSIKEFGNNEWKKPDEEKGKDIQVTAVRNRKGFKRVPIQ